MADKKHPKGAKPVKKPGDSHYGEMKEIRYPDTPGKRLGNWLTALFTGWMR